MSCPLQRTDPDTPVPRFVCMVLKDDMSFSLESEIRDIPEFARSDQGIQECGSYLVFHDFFTVQPVLPVIAFDQDTGLVPLTRTEILFSRGNEIVKSPCGLCRIQFPRVASIVDHLIFKSQG